MAFFGGTRSSFKFFIQNNGGFGGVTFDIIKKLKSENATWLREYYGKQKSNPRLEKGLELLSPYINELPENGLTPKENSQLATTYRPSEIATLISLGLGRLFSYKNDDK